MMGTCKRAGNCDLTLSSPNYEGPDQKGKKKKKSLCQRVVVQAWAAITRRV